MTRVAIAIALALAGCAAGPYQAYRDANPGWDGAFPTPEADVSRTVAALHAPGRGYAVTVTQVLAWRIEASTWTPIAPEQATAGGDYALVASLHCASNDGTTQFVRGANAWYLLPGNRLAAYDHYGFKPGCDLANTFEPARGARVTDEHTLLEKAGLPRPASASGASEYYEKGRAFLRAGRRDEANSMLVAGDSSGEGGFDVRARFNAPHAAGEQSPAEARAALVRELGARP